MNKILVVEDEKRIAELLQKGLAEFGYEVVLAYDGDMGMRLMNSSDYDLMIFDIVLPYHNGFELTKAAKEKNPDTPVIMLTALGTTDDKLDGFDAGADDYMVKPFDLRELNARIHVLLRRNNKAMGKSVPELKYADIVMNQDTHLVWRAGQEIKLTPKEFNLLKFFLENPERVLSRKEIAEKVWDTHFDTGTNFIDVYINYLRGKIDKGFDRKLIKTSPGVGFILKEGE